MRALLIVNPESGSGGDSGRLEPGLRQCGVEVTTVPIDQVDAQSAPSGVERVIVAGGDGSLGVAAAVAADLGVPLAVVPTGTANDLARALDLPLGDLDAAVELAARGTVTRALDLASAGGVPFLNTASAGLTVHASRRAAPWKRRLGALAYAAGAVHAGLTARAVHVTVTAGEEHVYNGRAWQVIVAGTGAFGGGSTLDTARPGALDVAVLVGPRARLLRHAYGMRLGKLGRQPGVVHARAREVTVQGPPTFNVDGDVRPVAGGRFAATRRVDVVTG